MLYKWLGRVKTINKGGNITHAPEVSSPILMTTGCRRYLRAMRSTSGGMVAGGSGGGSGVVVIVVVIVVD